MQNAECSTRNAERAAEENAPVPLPFLRAFAFRITHSPVVCACALLQGSARRIPHSALCALRSAFCNRLPAALALCFLTAAVAHAYEGEPGLDVSPFFRFLTSPWPESGTGPQTQKSLFEVLWPILESRGSAERSEFYLRPFYNRRNDKASQVIESDWLWPFGFGTERPDLDRQIIYPLFLHDRERTSDGAWRSRTFLLPLLIERSGFGPLDLLVFPFGGVLHNMFEREKIVMVLWPLYVFQESREARDWSFLYPIFSYIRWNDGGRGYKAWPLFGINRRPEKLLNVFVLWPIFFYQFASTGLGDIHAWAFWPFYSRTDSPGGWDWSVAWPFFGQHFERGETESWCPWPFVGRLAGPQVSGWTFWPAFSTELRPEKTRTWFLWPLGWYRHIGSPGAAEEVSFRLFPLMFCERETRRAPPGPEPGPEAESSGAWQAWPVVKWRRDAGGARHLEAPSILPMRWYAPWERNFAPFFRLFEYERAPDGGKSWRALWRILRAESSPTAGTVELAPVFKVYERSATATRGWSFLKGFLGYERSNEGSMYRFLYFLKLRRPPESESAESPGK